MLQCKETGVTLTILQKKAESAMNQIRHRWLLFLLLTLLFTGCAARTTTPLIPEAQNGMLDLSDRDFRESGNTRLSGDWAFYPGELILPGDFDDDSLSPQYCRVPEYWTRHDDLSLPSHGVGTYRLLVATDGTQDHFGLKIPEIYTEYSLWVNGTLLEANGSFADSPPVYLHPGTLMFSTKEPVLEIVLQIKNDLHVYAGIGQNIWLGGEESIRRESLLRSAFDFFLFAICLSAFVYHLILSLYRRGDRALMHFSILCFTVGIRTLFSNETLIMQVFPEIPFWIGSKIATLTVPVCVITTLLYVWDLFRDDVPPAFARVLLLLNGIYAALVLVASSTVYSALFLPYLGVVAAACFLAVFLALKAVYYRKKDYLFFFFGVAVLALAALIDILNFGQFVQTGYVLSFGLCGFILTQAILLAKRYTETFRDLERMSADLQESLDRTMHVETAFLNAQMKPHFLYNTLNTIAYCCKADPAEAERLILSLAKYLRGTLDFENLSGIIPLKKEIDLVRAYVSIEKARFETVDVSFVIDPDLPELQIPPLTIQPLVENAIRHGLRKQDGGGTVMITIRMRENNILVSVEDNGAGIPEEKLANLLDSPGGSVSIGLYNIHTRLLRLYGKGLSLSSKPGQGTSVRFTIPFERGASHVSDHRGR